MKIMQPPAGKLKHRSPPQGKIKKSQANEAKISIEHCGSFCQISPATLIPLSIMRSLSFRPKGYKHAPSFQDGSWDGYIAVYRKSRGENGIDVPIGLIPQFLTLCDHHEISWEFANDRSRPSPIIEPLNINDINLGGGFALRGYQQQMTAALLPDPDRAALYELSKERAEELSSGLGVSTTYRVDGCGIWSSSTGSGKTIASASLIARLGVRTLFLVYGNNLVLQTFERFRTMLGPWLESRGHFAEDVMSVCIEGNFDPREITVAGSSTFAYILSAKKSVSKDFIKALRKFRTWLGTHEYASQEDIQTIKRMQRSIDACYSPIHQSRIKDTQSALDDLLSINLEPIRLKGGAFLDKPKGSKSKGKWRPDHEWIDVANKMLKSINQYPEKFKDATRKERDLRKYLKTVDLLIVDEVHMSGGDGIQKIISACPAYYRCGTSGTPLDRSDGQNIKVLGSFGELVCKVTNKDMADAGVIPDVEVKIMSMRNGPKVKMPDGWGWHDLQKAGVVEYDWRNKIAVREVVSSFERGEKVMVLFRVVQHGELIAEELSRANVVFEKLDGRTKTQSRERALSKFKSGHLPVIVASEIFGTGIDIPDGFDKLVFLAGGKGKTASGDKGGIKVAQSIGRGLRKSGHTITIIDFDDVHHYKLAQHARSREEFYLNQGCFAVSRVEVSGDNIEMFNNKKGQ